MNTNIEKLDVCISDADVLVKLCKAGYLEVLGKIIKTVIIPDKVLAEVKRKVATHGKGMSISKAIDIGFIKVYAVDDLEPIQRKSFKAFVNSFIDHLGPGELKAAALANELDIKLMLSDDRDARNFINNNTNIKCVQFYYVLRLGELSKIITYDDVEKVYEAFNSCNRFPSSLSYIEMAQSAGL